MRSLRFSAQWTLLGSRSLINLSAQSIKGEMNDTPSSRQSLLGQPLKTSAMTCLTLAKRIGTQAA